MIPRRGYTLIEMMAVIFVLGIALELTVRGMVFIMRNNTAIHDEYSAQHEWLRLSRLFRADVRQAEHATFSNKGQNLTCVLPGGRRIVYRQDNPGLQRQEFSGAKIMRIEGFSPWEGKARFRMEDSGQVVSLLWESMPEVAIPAQDAGQHLPLRTIQVQTVVGADRWHPAPPAKGTP